MDKPVECRGCCFFARIGGEESKTGECRRKAPQVNWRVGQWPMVRVDDFCGDFIEAGK